MQNNKNENSKYIRIIYNIRDIQLHKTVATSTEAKSDIIDTSSSIVESSGIFTNARCKYVNGKGFILF